MGAKPNLTVRCPECKSHVTGTEHGSYLLDEDGYDQVRVTLVSCPDCEAPYLLTHVGDFSARGDDKYTDWNPPLVLYPDDKTYLASSVPKPIAASYQEALRVANDTAGYTAAAIMCRRTLEGICAHFKAPERKTDKNGKEVRATLGDKIDWLKSNDIIDGRIREWSHKILVALGNNAAHDVKEVIAREDAQDALDFTRAIIEYIFVFQAAFERFKKRQTDKANAKALAQRRAKHKGPKPMKIK